LPERANYQDVNKVIDVAGTGLQIISDVLSQKVVCLLT
jgi:hypothetical protein